MVETALETDMYISVQGALSRCAVSFSVVLWSRRLMVRTDLEYTGCLLQVINYK